jgi:hypothetical protein
MLTDELRKVIQRHIDRGWEDCRYEEMIVGETPHDPCIVDCLGLDVPVDRRDEVAWYAVFVMRMYWARSAVKRWADQSANGLASSGMQTFGAILSLAASFWESRKIISLPSLQS